MLSIVCEFEAFDSESKYSNSCFNDKTIVKTMILLSRHKRYYACTSFLKSYEVITSEFLENIYFKNLS